MSTNHSVYKEFDDALKTMITSISNNNAAPRLVQIIDNSFDFQNKRWFADVKLDGAKLKRIRCMGYPRKGAEAILIFLNGQHDYPYLICNSLDSIEYEEPIEYRNLLPNGTFKKFDDGVFDYWTGGNQTDMEHWYDDSTAFLYPNETITSNPVNIEGLRGGNGDLTIMMVYYIWKGGALELTIRDKDTLDNVVLAPENLGNDKEILPSTGVEWRENRSVFYLRNHRNIDLVFKNIDSREKVYLDGVRVWTQDFQDWYPSRLD